MVLVWLGCGGERRRMGDLLESGGAKSSKLQIHSSLPAAAVPAPVPALSHPLPGRLPHSPRTAADTTST